MQGRYEIVDGNNPTWRGMRFTSLDRARKELAMAAGETGRFYIFDRLTKERIG